MTEPILTNTVTMQQRRGLRSALPATAPSGQLLVTTDTSELYVGTGTGVTALVQKGHQTVYTIFEDSASVYADGLQGIADTKGREGWFFSNPGGGRKINWYFYDPTQFTTTVSNFRTGYAIVTLDKAVIPFFSVYTLPTGSEDAAVWYKSARVYSATSAVIPGKYLMHFGDNPNIYLELPRIALPANPAFTAGVFAATETVNLVSFGTDSSAAASQYAFVAHQLGFVTTATSREYNLRIKSDFGRTHTQAVASTTWTINHFTNRYPMVTTVDAFGQEIEGAITYTNANQLTISFNPAVAGKAYLL